MSLSILRFGMIVLLACTGTGVSARTASAVAGEICLRGVNLAGAEFGEIPGRYGFDYSYPTDRAIKSLGRLGLTAIRLPVRWERLQPELNKPLDQAELNRLDSTLGSIRDAGLHTILDLHNFGYYGAARLGSAAVPSRAFSDLWRRLATHLRRESSVTFGLMNEPYDLPAQAWLAAANDAIAAIRSAGARQLILVSGTAYSGAHSWTEDLPVGNNGLTMLGVRDPGGNFAYEVHQYLDADFSGRAPECDNGASALKAVENMSRWLSANRKRAFLGEIGASGRPECVAALSAILQHINEAGRSWIGWTVWAAGDRWPSDYPFKLQLEESPSPVLTSLARNAATATSCGSSSP
jgi:endoglucanase